MNINAKRIHIILVLGMAALFYSIILRILPQDISEEVMLSAYDSEKYIKVAEYLGGGELNAYVGQRMPLYPMLVLGVYFIGGVLALWFVQFLMWLTSAYLVFISAHRLTSSYGVAYAAYLLFITNLSALVMTLHLMTETFVAFLLSLLLWFAVFHIERRKELYFGHALLGLLVLLTLTKLLFFYLLWLSVLVFIPAFYWKAYRDTPKKLVYLLLIISPVLTHMFLMKKLFDQTTPNSQHDALKVYFIPKTLELFEGETRHHSVTRSLQMSDSETRQYIKGYPFRLIRVFFHNLRSNLRSQPEFLALPQGKKHEVLYGYARVLNLFYYAFHKAMVIVMMIGFLLWLRKKQYEKVVLYGILYGLAAFFVFMSGFVFDQGDRLFLPSIVLWIPVYLTVLFTLFRNSSVKSRTKDFI